MADVDKFAKEGVLRILVGNKCDLDSKRQVSFDNGKELADKYGIKFLETSAKETVNIDELFVSTTRLFMSKQATTGGKGMKTPTLGKNLNEETLNEKKKNDSCCQVRCYYDKQDSIINVNSQLFKITIKLYYQILTSLQEPFFAQV